MVIRNVSGACFLFALFLISGYCGEVTSSNWMASVASDKKLSRLSIPGTHNSCALHEPLPGTAKCQNLSIAQQLANGVRFLDIRCRHLNNAFPIYHGQVSQDTSFADVLTACLVFLTNQPTECIVISVKEEFRPAGNSRSFEDTFDSYVRLAPEKWYLQNAIPSLGEARGKLVLLRRFSAQHLPKGIDATLWQDNATFSTTNRLVPLRVQDRYIVKNNTVKWNDVQAMCLEASSAGPEVLCLNFASGYKPGLFGLPDITTVSDFINPRLQAYFAGAKTGHFGITIMDFADSKTCRLIIDANR